jgi:ubiquinone biosynthesis protein UbiJ
MSELRKITAFLPAKSLAAAQAYTGQGVTETLRIALEKLNRQAFYERLKALRGKVKFDDFNLEELRRDREFDEHGDIVDRD